MPISCILVANEDERGGHLEGDLGGARSKTEEERFKDSMKNVIKQSGYFDKFNPNHRRK